MPQNCSVCLHKSCNEINRLLLDGKSVRYIAEQYGFTASTVQRHKAHIPKKLAKAKEAKEVTEADDLMSELLSLKSRALSLMDQAEAAQNYPAAISAIGQARQVIETLAEVRGELDRRAIVNVNIIPVWVTIKAALFEALEPYPDARLAVSQKLKEIKQ